jgi:hypothetical protein
MSSRFKFLQQNFGWNADPNSPCPEITESSTGLRLRFYLNAFVYGEFDEGEVGILEFFDVARYRLGSTNDEGWYAGQCRFSGIAPAWGEFYAIEGDRAILETANDWRKMNAASSQRGHFLFYFRDNTFECVCARWEFALTHENALLRLSKSK